MNNVFHLPITKSTIFFRYEGVAKEYVPEPYHPAPVSGYPAPPYKSAQRAPYARQWWYSIKCNNLFISIENTFKI